MSGLLQRLRIDTSTAGSRPFLVGAVVGALVTLLISMTAAPPEGSASGNSIAANPLGGGPASPDAKAGTRYVFAAKVGTCLMWQRDDGADMKQVNCEEPHVFEVTQIVDVSADYPAGAPVPDTDTWRKIAKQRCTKGAERYLGKKLDPEGKLQVSALAPNEQDWKLGSRDLRCGLWRIGPGGSLQPTVGPAAEQDQSNVWATGTCLGLVDGAVGDPVPCAQKHSYEMISIVNLRTKFKSYPSTTKQNTYLDKVCNKEARSYSGGKDLEKLKLIVAWDTRSKASWQAGSYLVNCKVGALLKDKSGLAPVEGSIRAGGDDKKKQDDKPGSKASKPSSAPKSGTEPKDEEPATEPEQNDEPDGSSDDEAPSDEPPPDPPE